MGACICSARSSDLRLGFGVVVVGATGRTRVRLAGGDVDVVGPRQIHRRGGQYVTSSLSRRQWAGGRVGMPIARVGTTQTAPMPWLHSSHLTAAPSVAAAARRGLGLAATAWLLPADRGRLNRPEGAPRGFPICVGAGVLPNLASCSLVPRKQGCRPVAESRGFERPDIADRKAREGDEHRWASWRR